MSGGGLKLEELARRSGVTPRTIRYYIQRGLLPAPAFRGADTAYGEEHLDAIRAIKKLQEAYWPLDAIAEALAAQSPEAIARVARGEELPVVAHAPRTARAPAVSARAERTRVERIVLAPGLEILVDDAAPDARALAERIVRAHQRGDFSGDGLPKGGRR